MTPADVCRFATGSLAIGCLLVVGLVQAGTQRPEDLGVIPTPQNVTWTNESLVVDEATKIILPGAAMEEEGK